MRTLDKLVRRWQLRALDRVDADALCRVGARRAVAQFRRVARRVPTYATILRAHGLDPERIRTPDELIAHAPIIAKADVFGPDPLDRCCLDGQLAPLAGVLTSSGQGGRFAFGLITPDQARRTAKAIELALEYSFQTDRHSTLLVNALPMGVRFACSTVTLAETSVREDMIRALIERFGPYHEQIILVTDPLFCKRVIDHGREHGLHWGRFKIHLVLGEETFGEAFRGYAMRALGQDPDGWTRGLAVSSMGVGEIGLNLFFETRETIRLRQLADREPARLRPLLGDWPGRVPPLIFVYDPLRVFVEVTDPDAKGYGDLTLTTLDPRQPLPLIRYRTGDRARRLAHAEIAAGLAVSGQARIGLPALPMIAVTGRETDRLSDGRALLDLKDALYGDPGLADRLSGAFRVEHLEQDGTPAHRIHVQLGAGQDADPEPIAKRLATLLQPSTLPSRDLIQVWPHADFPFGRTLDYERKFDYLGTAASPR